MEWTGTLSVDSGESSLDGTMLAIEGDDDPLGAATDFLANRNLGNNDRAKITGDDGNLGTEDVIFMTEAEAVAEAHPLKVATASAERSAKKAGQKKPAKGAARKSATRKTSKNSSKKGSEK